MSQVQTVQAEKQPYVQALIEHRQPFQSSTDKTIGAYQVHFEEDALTKTIERDNAQLDRLIDICPSC
jgi:hypothetical protein